MKQYMPFSPVEINVLSKKDALEYLDKLISREGEILLLASDRIITTLGLEQWLSDVKKSASYIHLGKVPANPSVSDVYESLKALQKAKLVQIIAIGGGSCIDLAKAISALHYLIQEESLSKQTVYNVIKNKEYLVEHIFIDIIALPTTSGTGSEVTKWATVWDMEHKDKLSVDCVQLFPKVALLIPEFTTSMPKRLTLSTGLDALSHAMEAFWSKNRTPLSQALAISAINRVKEYLPKVMSNESDVELRKEMCTASLLAGLAFSITRTTACHSISYPLTMYFGLEHGFAVALTLVQVAERNEAFVPEIKQIYSIFGGKSEFTQWIMNVTSPVLDLRLSTFGISEKDLNLIVEKTFTQGRMDNNPIVFLPTDVKEILYQIY